jgi:hypothetical protein
MKTLTKLTTLALVATSLIATPPKPKNHLYKVETYSCVNIQGESYDFHYHIPYSKNYPKLVAMDDDKPIALSPELEILTIYSITHKKPAGYTDGIPYYTIFSNTEAEANCELRYTKTKEYK